jgi:hypothetical protein
MTKCVNFSRAGPIYVKGNSSTFACTHIVDSRHWTLSNEELVDIIVQALDCDGGMAQD